MDEKTHHKVHDDSASTSSYTMTEKASAKESGFPASTREDSKSPSPSLDEKHEGQPQVLEKQNSLKKITTAAEAQAELNRVMTSGEGIEYPTGIKLALITIALCLSVFLMALDNTIIATAIPSITNQFHSLPDVGWYGSA